MSGQINDKFSNLDDLEEMIPEKNYYILDLIGVIFSTLEEYAECTDNLVLKRDKGAYSIDLSNDKVIIFKPSNMSENFSDLDDLEAMIPEKNYYILDLIGVIFSTLEEYAECTDNLVLKRDKGAYSIDLSNDKVIIFKPSNMSENFSDLDDLEAMIPEKNYYILDLIGVIFSTLEEYAECTDNLMLKRDKGAYSIDLSNGKAIIFKPSVMDK